jgi:hypothetical protein
MDHATVDSRANPWLAPDRQVQYTYFLKEKSMNPADDKDQPGGKHGTNLPGALSRGKALQESPGEHPDQSGAEYGGYGHSDSPFGRDTGSSSVEGGQGGGEAGSGAETEPRTLRGGSDGGSQTRHASDASSQALTAKTVPPPGTSTGDDGGYRRDERYGGFAAEQRASPAPRQQGSDRADQNHQDQGGQTQRGPAHAPAEGNDPSGYDTPDRATDGDSPSDGTARKPGATQTG